jgi:hypothetical protein
MDRTSLAVLLKRQDAGSSCMVRVVLDCFCRADARNQVADRDAVGCELIVAVFGDPNPAAVHQGCHPLQNLAHVSRLHQWRRLGNCRPDVPDKENRRRYGWEFP